MRNLSYWAVRCIAGLILIGCHGNNHLREKMENIKKVGNSAPQKALQMLDSLSGKIRNESEGMQMQYDLLETCLKDKACIQHTSDIKIKGIVDYYESEGCMIDLQEAYYYAGSVYRDLKDAPKALEYFNKSVDCAVRLGSECDSVILRNAYSNLSNVEYIVQDNKNTLVYAKKEYELSAMLHNISVIPILHIGSAYLNIDSIAEAKEWFGRAYEIFSDCDTISEGESLYSLLYNYAYIGDSVMARNCYALTGRFHGEIDSDIKQSNLGAFFVMSNQIDSAAICFEKIADESSNLFSIYDASRELYNIYRKKGNLTKTLYYADLFMEMSDSINFGRRQELAATVNNQFQYQRDKNEEMRIMKEHEKVRFLLIMAIIVIMVISLGFIILFTYKKKRNIETLLLLSDKMNKLEAERDRVTDQINEKEKDLEESRQKLNNHSKEIEQMREKLSAADKTLEIVKAELKEKEKLLLEKIEQNKSIMNLMRMSEFERNAEDLIIAIRQAAGGTKKLTHSEWAEFYNAVDELHPNFKNLLVEKLENFSERQMQMCYLMRIGLTPSEIQNLTEIPRATIWRWTKKFSWVLEGMSKAERRK